MIQLESFKYVARNKSSVFHANMETFLNCDLFIYLYFFYKVDFLLKPNLSVYICEADS